MSVLPAGLPHLSYIDADRHAEELAKIFRRGWLCIGAATALRTGSISIDIAGTTIDIHCDANVWRASSAGQPVAVEQLGGLMFASFDDRVPLRTWLAPYADWLELATVAEPVYTQSHTVPCNWKLLIENTLDDCHGGTLHAGSLQQSFPDWRHSLSLSRYDSGSDIRLTLGDTDRRFWQKLQRRLGLSRFGSGEDYRHVFMFPNFYVSTFFDAMVLLHRVEPLDAERSLLTWDLLLPLVKPETAARPIYRGVVAELARQAEQVIAEDLAMCALAQRGRHFAVYPGVLSEREIRIADFQARLQAAMIGHPGLPNR